MGLQPAPNDAVRDKANAVMNRIGTGLLKQTKASLADDKANSKSSRRKDILSLLARANAMEEEAQRITDQDMMARGYRLILDWSFRSIYSQRSPLSLSPVTKQRGTHVCPLSILQLRLTNFGIVSQCRGRCML
jgi:hypothetical protein